MQADYGDDEFGEDWMVGWRIGWGWKLLEFKVHGFVDDGIWMVAYLHTIYEVHVLLVLLSEFEIRQ